MATTSTTKTKTKTAASIRAEGRSRGSSTATTAKTPPAGVTDGKVPGDPFPIHTPNNRRDTSFNPPSERREANTYVPGENATVDRAHFDRYLNSYSPYITAENTARTAYEEGMAQADRDSAGLNSDYFDTFRNLGLNFGDSNPLADGQLSAEEIGQANWNYNDPNFGYGQGYQALQNSAASRGMRNSTFYADELDNFQRSYDDQRQKLLSALTQGMTEIDAGKTGLMNDYNGVVGGAINSAAESWANQYGVDSSLVDAQYAIDKNRKK